MDLITEDLEEKYRAVQRLTGDLHDIDSSASSRDYEQCTPPLARLAALIVSLLCADLEHALNAKLEQQLWNVVFRRRIVALQNTLTSIKTTQSEQYFCAKAKLGYYLDYAIGFYTSFVRQFVCLYADNLSLSCEMSSLIQCMPNDKFRPQVSQVSSSSCLYLVQHCLVRMGDLFRYANRFQMSKTYYLQAASLVPSSGQPFNQLALLAAQTADRLTTVYYYIRALHVRTSSHLASTNLDKLFSILAKQKCVLKCDSFSDFSLLLLQSHAILFHLLRVPYNHVSIVDTIKYGLYRCFGSQSVCLLQIIQVFVLNVYSVNRLSADQEMPDGETNLSSSSRTCHHVSATALRQFSHTLLVTCVEASLCALCDSQITSDLSRHCAIVYIRLFLLWALDNFTDDQWTSMPATVLSLFCLYINSLLNENTQSIACDGFLPEDHCLRGFSLLSLESTSTSTSCRHLELTEMNVVAAVTTQLCVVQLFGRAHDRLGDRVTRHSDGHYTHVHGGTFSLGAHLEHVASRTVSFDGCDKDISETSAQIKQNNSQQRQNIALNSILKSQANNNTRRMADLNISDEFQSVGNHKWKSNCHTRTAGSNSVMSPNHGGDADTALNSSQSIVKAQPDKSSHYRLFGSAHNGTEDEYISPLQMLIRQQRQIVTNSGTDADIYSSSASTTESQQDLYYV